MKKIFLKKKIIYLLLFILISSFCQAQTTVGITATGNQPFCPTSPIKIVTDFTISDPSNTGVDNFFIQISSGYQINFDKLDLDTKLHPTITKSWDNTQGKLGLAPNGVSEIAFDDLIKAVKDVEFITTSTNVIAEKSFSLTIGNANYLPSTTHFYEYVDDLSITWTNAKAAAAGNSYFGLEGYLATLTSQEEADFAGKQAAGAGWIGATDEAQEGSWRWVTGPEAGTLFWNGNQNGVAVGFENWNTGEPNNVIRGNDGEHYAHITDPSIGNRGSWNDLPNAGDPPGPFHPKGYIVEYGGMPGDPSINIVADTKIFLPKITNITNDAVCETETATINAATNNGTIEWFTSPSGGTPIFFGNSYTTSPLTKSTIFYAGINFNGCTDFKRIPVTITVTKTPTITSSTDDLICSGKALLNATASQGDVVWFESRTSTTPIYTGNSFTTPNLSVTTSYFVEARNNSCISSTRTEVIAKIDNLVPIFDLVKDNYVLCKEIGSATLETKNANGNFTYIWTKDGTPIPNNSSSLTVSSEGKYTVKAISLAGCESIEETIRVTESERAKLTNMDVMIIDDNSKNSIEIINPNLGIGDYKFSLDDEFGPYKNQSFFENLSVGVHTLYIKDDNGCGITSYSFSILAFPKFFTPNGDQNNDVWKINGFNNSQFTSSDVNIYNRFGILIHKIDPSEGSWNGTYQGKLLPSNTYWYRATLIDTNNRKIEKIGSFSLIRN